jgi:hypothetical protein
VNAQFDLFATSELARDGIWRQLPEESRQQIGDLFARLVLAYAVAKESEARDER